LTSKEAKVPLASSLIELIASLLALAAALVQWRRKSK
jgi:hypothetical protein